MTTNLKINILNNSIYQKNKKLGKTTKIADFGVLAQFLCLKFSAVVGVLALATTTTYNNIYLGNEDNFGFIAQQVLENTLFDVVWCQVEKPDTTGNIKYSNLNIER